jgi:predicted membrane-bound mannosyltransferase
MAYYSRYFIHETALVLFSFGALLAACRYRRAPGPGPAVLAGVCAGLMLATKETAVLALASMLVAFALARRGAEGGRVNTRHVLLAGLAAVSAAALFFSSFLTRPTGVVDGVRAYAFYLRRAGATSWHLHPWSYYLELLVPWRAAGPPLWTEGLIVVLAVAGGAAGWTGHRAAGADPRGVRFLALYTLLLLVAYSAIPYKTPWCLLGFLHGMILLAGVGAVVLVRSMPGGAARALAVALLAAGAVHLGGQAFLASFRFAADPRNPYVYAHTGTDVFEIVRRVKDLARAHPDGPALRIQVVSRENLWPLPFYLRGLPRVEWWTGVDDASPAAPVVLITPEMEPALVRKLYDLPPPGERELYISIFERPVEIRPAVELRGYAAAGLWDAYRRLE